MILFIFILFWIYRASCGLMNFISYGKFLSLIYSDFASTPSPFSSFYVTITTHKVELFTSSSWFSPHSHFPSFLYLRISFWIFSLTHQPVPNSLISCVNLLLNPTTEIFLFLSLNFLYQIFCLIFYL